jgi:hypothetical protein
MLALFDAPPHTLRPTVLVVAFALLGLTVAGFTSGSGAEAAEATSYETARPASAASTEAMPLDTHAASPSPLASCSSINIVVSNPFPEDGELITATAYTNSGTLAPANRTTWSASTQGTTVFSGLSGNPQQFSFSKTSLGVSQQVKIEARVFCGTPGSLEKKFVTDFVIIYVVDPGVIGIGVGD